MALLLPPLLVLSLDASIAVRSISIYGLGITVATATQDGHNSDRALSEVLCTPHPSMKDLFPSFVLIPTQNGLPPPRSSSPEQRALSIALLL